MVLRLCQCHAQCFPYLNSYKSPNKSGGSYPYCPLSQMSELRPTEVKQGVQVIQLVSGRTEFKAKESLPC